ncbi:hypothetical protein ABAC460_16630 [Asticcacaulis sp. AC460]|uniref:toxin-antitoxin system YwqK family antitoxin n=1 Tax=Asticcacaulis sp. AC460 TaxID=1282360 RepID=UPI0003C3DDA4|nr:hypothetical protein ABAC460_16630 [Asticcacaulis sp. AC460]
MADLNIAEIPYEDGSIRFRYSRYLAADGQRWIRHGLFVAYHPNGALASEGSYTDGEEQGVWKDYHPNGQVAAVGSYEGCQALGKWEYWDEDGRPEPG